MSVQPFNSENTSFNPMRKSSPKSFIEIGEIKLSQIHNFEDKISDILSTDINLSKNSELSCGKNIMIFGARSIKDKMAFIKNILKTAEYKQDISPAIYSKTLVRENIRCDLPIHHIFDNLSRIDISAMEDYIKTHTTPITGLLFLDLTHSLSDTDNKILLSLANIMKSIEENSSLKLNIVIFADNFGIDNYMGENIDATVIYNIKNRGKLQSAYDRFAGVNVMTTTQFCERCIILKQDEFAVFQDGSILFSKIKPPSTIDLIDDFWIYDKFGTLFIDSEKNMSRENSSKKLIFIPDDIPDAKTISPKVEENNEIISNTKKIVGNSDGKSKITVSIDNNTNKQITFSIEFA